MNHCQRRHINRPVRLSWASPRIEFPPNVDQHPTIGSLPPLMSFRQPETTQACCIWSRRQRTAECDSKEGNGGFDNEAQALKCWSSGGKLMDSSSFYGFVCPQVGRTASLKPTFKAPIFALDLVWMCNVKHARRAGWLYEEDFPLTMSTMDKGTPAIWCTSVGNTHTRLRTDSFEIMVRSLQICPQESL